MVQEICRDIRQLDCAKRHLQTTITALKRSVKYIYIYIIYIIYMCVCVGAFEPATS